MWEKDGQNREKSLFYSDLCSLGWYPGWYVSSSSSQDSEKRTPLHAAAFLGDAEIIELLILSGRLLFALFSVHFPKNMESFFKNVIFLLTLVFVIHLI